jgi:uncharacterized membrane protein (DUF4010 family)
LGAALGIGLLLGTERERRRAGDATAIAGLRTFALVALGGAVARISGSDLLLAAGIVVIGGATIVAYALGDRRDPGLTSEVALVVAYLLGVTAVDDPSLAAALGVMVTVILAGREQLHRLVRDTLTDQELRDGLLLSGLALVILPLLPDTTVGPYAVLNPAIVGRLVVIVMAISALGYVAVRALGPALGLPLAGFAGGFVSSVATIGAMGTRARHDPALTHAAVAGATLSSLATAILLAIVIGATSPATLDAVLPPLVGSGLAAGVYAGLVGLRALRTPPSDDSIAGRAFDVRAAVAFAAVVTTIIFVSAAANEVLGTSGLVVATALAGAADAHAAAISVGSIVAAGNLAPADAVVPILVAFTANAASKCAVAFWNGGRRFGVEITVGQAAMLAAAWGAWAVPALNGR